MHVLANIYVYMYSYIAIAIYTCTYFLFLCFFFLVCPTGITEIIQPTAESTTNVSNFTAAVTGTTDSNGAIHLTVAMTMMVVIGVTPALFV